MRLKNYIIILGFILFVILLFLWIFFSANTSNNREKKTSAINSPDTLPIVWSVPDIRSIPATPKGELIKYGEELIMHTGAYYGPKGKISKRANGMNCQNCHLYSGTKLFGNNFSLISSTYPRFRPRSGKVVTLADRINGCMERSMNGDFIDTTSREMRAIIAYLNWISKDVFRTTKVIGSGIEKLPYLDRAADSIKGELVYILKCARCHGANGQGILKFDSAEYFFPPLWGPKSYNTGAGIYRVSIFAGFVKNNMPFGATHNFPLLSNKEAWDVAAFVNSKPHPYIDCSSDWPVLDTKPVDYPFGPYADSFTEKEHKYGPYSAIVKK